jgi:hypothetical protein
LLIVGLAFAIPPLWTIGVIPYSTPNASATTAMSTLTFV